MFSLERLVWSVCHDYKATLESHTRAKPILSHIAATLRSSGDTLRGMGGWRGVYEVCCHDYV